MANSWGNNGNNDRLFFGAPKSLWMVMAAMKLKDIYLLLERKDKTNLDSVLKSKCIILPTKVRIVKAMVFLVVIYGCECWTIKKIEHQKIDPFELCCWRRHLRLPCSASQGTRLATQVNPKGNQS